MDRANSKRGFWDGLDMNLLTSGYTVGNAKFAPNGRFIAYTKTLELGTQLYVFDLEIQEHFQLTHSTPLSTGTPYNGETYCWGSESNWIYYSSKGNLFRINANGGPPQALNGIDKSFSPHVVGHNLVFCVEHENNMSIGILKISDNMENTWAARIGINENFLYDPVLHPTDHKIALHCWSFPNMSWNGSQIKILDSTSSNLVNPDIKSVSGNDSVATSQPRFSPSGNHLVYHSDETGWLNLWIADSNGENPRILVEEPYEHAYTTWVTGGRNFCWIDDENIVFTRNNKGFWDLSVVNIITNNIQNLKTPTGFYSHLSFDQTEGKLVCSFEDHSRRSAVMLISLEKSLNQQGAFNFIANSGLKFSKAVLEAQTKPELIKFPTSDGESAYGLLYATKDNKSETLNTPLIVSVHGGPTGLSVNKHNPTAQYFTSRGYSYFEVNYRGSAGHGRQYREILNGNWGIYDVNDSVDALKYLISQGIADKAKTAIMGGSAGGYTVLMTLANQPGQFKAGINLFGVSDNFLLAEDTHYLESRYIDSLLGTLPEDSAKYFERSPIFLADKIVDPLLILQGEVDPVVPKNQSLLIKEKVKGYVEYKEYEGEGHGFRKESSLADMYPRIERFLKRYVLYQQ